MTPFAAQKTLRVTWQGMCRISELSVVEHQQSHNKEFPPSGRTDEGTNNFTPAAFAAFATTSWALKPGSSAIDLTSLLVNPESSPTVLITTSTP